MSSESQEVKKKEKKEDEVKKFTASTMETPEMPQNMSPKGNSVQGVKRQARGLKALTSLAGFDPWAKENRQIVADCKRARTMGHQLGDKCRKILAMVDAQERARGKGGKKGSGPGAGSGAPYTDLNVQWEEGRKGGGKCAEARRMLGSGLAESEKYYSDVYIKGVAGKSELIGDDPKQNSYGIRAANCFGRRQKGTIYTQAPVFNAQAAEFRGEAGQAKMKQMLAEFFRNPEQFKATHNNFIYETIAIKVKSMMLEAEGEGTEDEEGFDMANASAPQPMAASATEVEDAWYLGLDDIQKARKILKSIQKSQNEKK